MAERVRVRDVTNEEGNRLLRIVRRSSGAESTGAQLPGDEGSRTRPRAAVGTALAGLALIALLGLFSVRRIPTRPPQSPTG